MGWFGLVWRLPQTTNGLGRPGRRQRVSLNTTSTTQVGPNAHSRTRSRPWPPRALKAMSRGERPSSKDQPLRAQGQLMENRRLLPVAQNRQNIRNTQNMNYGKLIDNKIKSCNVCCVFDVFDILRCWKCIFVLFGVFCVMNSYFECVYRVR